MNGCCGVSKNSFFALSYEDFRVYLRDIKAGVKTITEELDDFMGLPECALANVTGDVFTKNVIESLQKFQNKEKK